MGMAYSSKRCKSKNCLIARGTSRARTGSRSSDLWALVGSSDPNFLLHERIWLQAKKYPRDNRVMTSQSSYRSCRLPPRCWLNLSTRCSSWERFVCSSIKKLRELSSERRETARLLSFTNVKNWGNLSFVRKDQDSAFYSVLVVLVSSIANRK